MKNCKRCETVKDFSDFYKNLNLKHGLSLYCKICMKELTKKTYSNNREKRIKKIREWEKKNPETVIKQRLAYGKKNKELLKKRSMLWHASNSAKKWNGESGDLTLDDINELLKTTECVFCGATEDLTLDHIIPVSKGGENTKSNIQRLCRRCNSSKGNRV